MKVSKINIAASMTALLLLLSWGNPALAFCRDSPDSQCHKDITKSALGFLRPWVIRELAGHVTDPDDLNLLEAESAHHFDDCNFDGGTASMNQRYSDPQIGAVSRLSPHRRTVLNVIVDYPVLHDALKSWAFALHGAQDFYSHSNWIEMGLRGSDQIVDRRLGPWRHLSSDWDDVRGDVGDGMGDVLTAQRPLPAGWSMVYPGHPYVPIVIDSQGRQHHLLVSGEAGWPNACPTGAQFSHDDQLNKDDSVPPPNAVQSPTAHVQAATMATHQTRHEWCRLQRLAMQANGVAGVGVLMGLLVDPLKSPHPPGSLCEAAPPGPVQVTVSVTGLRVLRDKEDDGPGQMNFVLSGFSESMRRSRASQSVPVVAGAGTLLPAAAFPAPVTLCMSDADRLVATLQGWEDDGSEDRGKLSSEDDLLNGVTVAFGVVSNLPAQPMTRRITQRSDNPSAPDLEVTFQVTRSGLAAPSAACQSPVLAPQ